MPDPSELFTNVYVKGFGIEVNFISFFYSFIYFSKSFVPYHSLLGKIENKFLPDLFAVSGIDLDTSY